MTNGGRFYGFVLSVGQSGDLGRVVFTTESLDSLDSPGGQMRLACLCLQYQIRGSCPPVTSGEGESHHGDSAHHREV